LSFRASWAQRSQSDYRSLPDSTKSKEEKHGEVSDALGARPEQSAYLQETIIFTFMVIEFTTIAKKFGSN
jgi:hypothetical protein